MLEILFTEINEGEFHDESEVLKKFKLLKDEPSLVNDTSTKADIMAFQFMENYPNKTSWGAYFGPMYEAGLIRIPSYDAINEEIINHWEKRLDMSVNPVLTARYAGLIWDFKKKVIDISPNISVATTYIVSLIKIVNNKHQSEHDLIEKVNRALSVSISISNEDLICKSKDAIIRLENEIGGDGYSGSWGFSFDSLIGHKKISLTSTEEKDIIDKLELRLANVLNDKTHSTRGAELIVSRLSKYYYQKGQKENTFRVLNKLGDIVEKDIASKSGLQKINSLRKLQTLYKKYGMEEQSKDALVKIRESGGDIHKNMKRVSQKIQIPKEQINDFVELVTSGTKDEIFYRIIDTFTPKTELLEMAVKEQSELNPISSMMSNSLIDEKGRIVSTIGSIDSDVDGHVIRAIVLSFQHQSIFLTEVYKKIIGELDFKLETFLEFIKKSKVFEEDRLKIIEKGIQAYFDSDYMVCLHLLIPQIEEGVRNLIELNSGVVLKPNESGAFQLKTFNELINDQLFEIILSKDFRTYFKCVFTDTRGWNLRNKICHGLSNTSSFNGMTAERIIHCLLVLGAIRFKKQQSC